MPPRPEPRPPWEESAARRGVRTTGLTLTRPIWRGRRDAQVRSPAAFVLWEPGLSCQSRGCWRLGWAWNLALQEGFRAARGFLLAAPSAYCVPGSHNRCWATENSTDAAGLPKPLSVQEGWGAGAGARLRVTPGGVRCPGEEMGTVGGKAFTAR